MTSDFVERHVAPPQVLGGSGEAMVLNASRMIVRNRVLANLPLTDFEALRPHLVPVDLERNAIVQDSNTAMTSVHFVESGLLSRVARTQSDGFVEVAVVGRSGFIGVGAALGTMMSLHRTVVLVPGHALRIEVGKLQVIMDEQENIRSQLLRYVQVLMMEKSQISLCNARHDIDQRVARWLLLASAKLGQHSLPITHDLVSIMLGVRRAGVTVALSKFEEDGALEKRRGSIDILDPKQLTNRACECCRIIDKIYDRYSGPTKHVDQSDENEPEKAYCY